MSRIVVHKKVYKKFTQMLVERAKGLRVGNGLDEKTDVGPVINAEALDYMRWRGLAGSVIARLEADPEHWFADEAAWIRHLERLGITTLAVTPDPVLVATEGAVWGAIKAHGLLPDTVVLSDDAGQFASDGATGWTATLSRRNGFIRGHAATPRVGMSTHGRP